MPEKTEHPWEVLEERDSEGSASSSMYSPHASSPVAPQRDRSAESPLVTPPSAGPANVATGNRVTGTERHFTVYDSSTSASQQSSGDRQWGSRAGDGSLEERGALPGHGQHAECTTLPTPSAPTICQSRGSRVCLPQLPGEVLQACEWPSDVPFGRMKKGTRKILRASKADAEALQVYPKEVYDAFIDLQEKEIDKLLSEKKQMSKIVNFCGTRIFQAHSIGKDTNLVEVRFGTNLARRHRETMTQRGTETQRCRQPRRHGKTQSTSLREF